MIHACEPECEGETLSDEVGCEEQTEQSNLGNELEAAQERIETEDEEGSRHEPDDLRVTEEDASDESGSDEDSTPIPGNTSRCRLTNDEKEKLVSLILEHNRNWDRIRADPRIADILKDLPNFNCMKWYRSFSHRALKKIENGIKNIEKKIEVLFLGITQKFGYSEIREDIKKDFMDIVDKCHVLAKTYFKKHFETSLSNAERMVVRHTYQTDGEDYLSNLHRDTGSATQNYTENDETNNPITRSNDTMTSEEDLLLNNNERRIPNYKDFLDLTRVFYRSMKSMEKCNRNVSSYLDDNLRSILELFTTIASNERVPDTILIHLNDFKDKIARIDKIEDKVVRMEDRIVRMEDKIVRMEDKISRMESRIDSIEDKIGRMQETMAKGMYEIIQMVGELKETRQTRSL